MIDPATGAYAVENDFNLNNVGLLDDTAHSARQFRNMVSPDRKRLAVQSTVDGDRHAGWIDATGNFTDVTADIYGKRSNFSGPIESTPLGFDGQGKFYYEKVRDQRIVGIWSLPPDATSGPTLVDEGDGYIAAIEEVATLNDDLVQLFGRENVYDMYSWLGNDFFAVNKAAQIDRTSSAGNTIGLLPENSDRAVSEPIPSPDGTQVVFLSDKDLYVVDADGGAQPKKLDNAQLPNDKAQLVGWV